MTGDNLDSTFGLDLIPEPTEEEYRLASQQIAVNGRSHEDTRQLLQALGFLPYPAVSRHRGGTMKAVVRRCNGYFARRAQAARVPA